MDAERIKNISPKSEQSTGEGKHQKEEPKYLKTKKKTSGSVFLRHRTFHPVKRIALQQQRKKDIREGAQKGKD